MISITTRAVVAAALACSLAAPLRAGETARVFDPGVVRRITPEEVERRRDAGEKPIILDARAGVNDVTIHGAVHVPNERIEAWARTEGEYDPVFTTARLPAPRRRAPPRGRGPTLSDSDSLPTWYWPTMKVAGGKSKAIGGPH